MMLLNHRLGKCTAGYKLTKLQEKMSPNVHGRHQTVCEELNELETPIQAVRINSQDIEKCAMIIITSGKQHTEGMELPNQENIKTHGEKETYK